MQSRFFFGVNNSVSMNNNTNDNGQINPNEVKNRQGKNIIK